MNLHSGSLKKKLESYQGEFTKTDIQMNGMWN